MGEGQGSSQDLTDLEVEVQLLSAYLLVPLVVSTGKEVIVLVVFYGGDGPSVVNRSLDHV
jgi:hypothetical protein